MTTINEKIAMFAKSNKISKAKLAEFVAELSTMKKDRKTAVFFDTVKAGIKKGNVTSSQLVEYTGTNIAKVNNALHSMEKSGIIVRSGVITDHKGKGKKPVLWSVK